MLYDFLSPRRLAFGWGRRAEVGELARTLGSRAFVIHGARAFEESGVLDGILDSLRAAGVEPVPTACIEREPLVEDVDRAVALVRDLKAAEGDLFVALGGGSAIDLAKATGALAPDEQSPTVADYLEGVGKGLRVRRPPLPVLAMPTTSGTGSEATKNAVISSHEPTFKKSLRSDLMVPRIVLVDPELTVSVPPRVTAHTGMDAITQCIESYISRRARPIPQALALQGLELAAPAIARAVEDGSDRPAREAMSHAALLSGMALANSGLGLAHGVAAALGVHCRVPHGLACAVMLPVAMRVNRPVCEERIARVGEILTGRSWPSAAQAADAAVESIEALCRRVGIPERLGEIGVERERIADLVSGSRGNSMNGNPRELDDEELRELLEDLL